jgi:CRP-like cAMP-binding protein
VTGYPAAGLAAHLSADHWTALVATGITVHFQRGQRLFDQGDPGRHVYVILEGAVKVVQLEPDGGQAMLTVRTVGDVVGDMAALDGRPRSATVTALSSLLGRMLTAEQFRRYVDRPGVAAGFTKYLLARLREADERGTELALLPVRVRLARCLLRLAVVPPSDPTVRLVSLPQAAIAQLVGASRNAIVAELATLRSARVIATRRGAVVIEDVAALRRCAVG